VANAIEEAIAPLDTGAEEGEAKSVVPEVLPKKPLTENQYKRVSKALEVLGDLKATFQEKAVMCAAPEIREYMSKKLSEKVPSLAKTCSLLRNLCLAYWGGGLTN